MGYTTDFYGHVTVTPPLNADELAYLTDFSLTRHMDRTKGPLFIDPDGGLAWVRPTDVLNHNRPSPEQPGLWCQWAPDGAESISWDQGEKFYCAPEWMVYLIDCLLSEKARAYVDAHMDEDPRLASFTCDHFVNGTINAQGEDPDDRWRLQVVDNEVTVAQGTTSYGPATKVA